MCETMCQVTSNIISIKLDMEIQDVIQYVTDGESQPITHVQAKIADLAEVSPKTVAAWMRADSIPLQKQALIHWKTQYELRMPE